MLPEFIEGLLRPEAYPHPTGQIRLIQTHISYVLMTGEIVYKIKKPVTFGFLDFTTLDKRKYFCEREVILNQRLSPEIYIGVQPITAAGHDYFVNGPGRPVEYAVKMRQMPQDRMMDALINKKEIQEWMIDRIVDKLVPFYERAAVGPGIDFYGEIPQIRFNVEENFLQITSYVSRALSKKRFEAIQSYALSFLKDKSALFQERIKSGKIRDGHGDLYSANICIAEDVHIYDCIEFNERFRYGDVASDLAFLAMDLDYHHLQDLSNRLVNRYIKLSEDYSLAKVLDFYKCYRACVRGKIHCFSADSPEIDEEQHNRSLAAARRYFELARLYAGGGGRPLLFVIFGLIAGGKSTLAEALGKKLNTVPLSSDRTRKELAGISPAEKRPEAFGQGIYGAESSRLTYRTLREEARERIMAGELVILDAAYGKRDERTTVAEMAEELDIPYCFIYCHCSESETRVRLEKRARSPETISDGRWEILTEQARFFEQPDEIPEDHLLRISTDADPDELATRVLESCMPGIQPQRHQDTKNTS
ncbi:MAG: AAA family ATPase [Pseudomonadota bacterium]